MCLSCNCKPWVMRIVPVLEQTNKEGLNQPSFLFSVKKIPNLIVFLNHLLLKNVVSTSVSGNIVEYDLDQLIHWQQLLILGNICLKKPKNKTKESRGTGGSTSCIHSSIQCEMVSAPNMGEPVRQKSKIQLCAVSEGHLRVGDKSRLKVKEEVRRKFKG